MTEDRFTHALGNRRGSTDARVAAPPSPPIVRARALAEQMAERAVRGKQSRPDSPVAEVHELVPAQDLSFAVLATRSFAEGAVIVFELRDARDGADRDWRALLVWRAPGTWRLYVPDAGSGG